MTAVIGAHYPICSLCCACDIGISPEVIGVRLWKLI